MKTTKNEAVAKSKFGINLWVYETNTKDAGFVYTEVAGGILKSFIIK